MNKPRQKSQPRVTDLIILLDKMCGLHVELLEAVQDKTDAMKRADIHAVREACDKERALVQRIHEREGLRRQLVDVIAPRLGIAEATVRTMSVSQLATHVLSPDSDKLNKTAIKLREVMERLARANNTAGVIARNLVGHLRWVFASVRPSDETPVCYLVDGAVVSRSDTKIFEAVG